MGSRKRGSFNLAIREKMIVMPRNDNFIFILFPSAADLDGVAGIGVEKASFDLVVFGRRIF